MSDAPQPAAPVRLVQISDVHFSEQPGVRGFAEHDPDAGLAAVLEHAAEALHAADAVIASGDLADTGEPAAYRRLGEVLAGLSAPVHCLPGNHDRQEAYAAELPRPGVHVGGPVRLGPWLILLADSNALGQEHVGDGAYRDLDGRMTLADSPSLTEAEDKRLRGLLQDSDAEHVLLFLHQPPLENICPHLDPEGRLAALLKDFPEVRAMAAGHLHGDLTGEYAGRPVYVTPSTTYSIDYPGRRFDGPGYRVFTLHPDGGIETEVRTAPGPITDAMRARPAPRFLTDLMLGLVTVEDMRGMTDAEFEERFGEPRPVRGHA
jgi:Icc protein